MSFIRTFSVLCVTGFVGTACPSIPDEAGTADQSADETDRSDVDNSEVDETIDETVETPLPDVWGLDAMEDEDPTAGVVEYTIRIGETTRVLLPDTEPTSVYAYNDVIPGPLLQARVGDTVRINAINELDEPTTIHWHGLRIDYLMDGVPYGSLPTIQPGETFVYDFVPPDAGTYWYHPHVRTVVQVERGLYGMFIVHERDEEVPDVDTDRAFVLDDVRVEADGSISDFATSGPDIVHGRSGNVLLTNGEADGVSFLLAPGAVERWRFVNTANAREMLLRFVGLEVREIGADGGLWPQEFVRDVDEIPLAVGARAELEVRLAEGAETAEIHSMVFVLNELDQVVQAPIVIGNITRGDDEVETEKRGHFADPEQIVYPSYLGENKTMELSAANVNGVIEMYIDGHKFEDAPIWEVTQGDLQVIKIVNELPQNGHPFHLHGQFFQVIRRDDEPADEPGWRDTVMIPGGQGSPSVTIVTTFDNPGTWMYHCHILEHAEAGMMALVEVHPKDDVDE